MIDQFWSSLNPTQRNRFTNAILAVVILLAIFLGVKAVSGMKEYSHMGEGVYPSNTITVNGTGRVFTIPDTGLISFSVVEEGKNVGIAQDKSAKKMNSILEAVKALGLEDKDIKTTGYNSYPKYEYQTVGGCSQGYCPTGKNVLTGYEVSQTISIKIRKVDTAGDILTKVGSLGATNISGLTFVTDDLDKTEREARDKAIGDAKEKAKTLAKALGVKLGKIVSFYENGGNPPIYYASGVMEGKVADSQAVPELPAGENETVSSVSITYEIR